MLYVIATDKVGLGTCRSTEPGASAFICTVSTRETALKNPSGKGIFVNFNFVELWVTEIRQWMRGMYMNAHTGGMN